MNLFHICWTNRASTKLERGRKEFWRESIAGKSSHISGQIHGRIKIFGLPSASNPARNPADNPAKFWPDSGVGAILFFFVGKFKRNCMASYGLIIMLSTQQSWRKLDRQSANPSGTPQGKVGLSHHQIICSIFWKLNDQPNKK